MVWQLTALNLNVATEMLFQYIPAPGFSCPGAQNQQRPESRVESLADSPS